ncbi:MAG TPA: peptide ABC transporter permease [Actinobacteria bacterium]|nr:peptide ABC transporter permease [Actinomycetota bacterium]
MSRWALIWRRFRRNKVAIGGLIVIGVLFVLAFLGPLVTPWSYEQIDGTSFLKPPSPKHWFGTSQIGQDIFAQTMRGLQKSMIIGLLVGVISTSLAAFFGATAGYFRGTVERVNLFVISLLLVVPDFLIIAIISPRLRDSSWLWLVLLISIFTWMLTAMVIYNLTLSLKQREFVTAARFMGVPARQIITRHILPNMASFLIIDATLSVGAAVLLESGLSYFGFGVQPPDVSLGTLIADGTGSALTYPWVFLFAGAFLVILVLAVSVVGDGLRDAVDPQSQAKAEL